MKTKHLTVQQLQLLMPHQLREILKQRTKIPRMFSFIKSAYGRSTAKLKVIGPTTVCTLTGSGGPLHIEGIWMGHTYARERHCYYFNHLGSMTECRVRLEQLRHKFNRISEISRRGDPLDHWNNQLGNSCEQFPLHFFVKHPPVDRDLYLLIWQVLDLFEGRRVSLKRIALGL